jgi:hypothetical protein
VGGLSRAGQSGLEVASDERLWRVREPHILQSLDETPGFRSIDLDKFSEHVSGARALRVDPRARPRLVEFIANLRDRMDEARANGWTGEVGGLQTSLKIRFTFSVRTPLKQG